MPVIILDINDDEDFTSCEYCKRHVQPYNNTSLSTTPIHNLYTKTLLSYHHLNCQKCGLYIELHPKHANDEGLIFLCPNHVPHKHCLCYECGLLYNLETHNIATDILSQLQYNDPTQTPHTQIQPQGPQQTTNNVLASNNNLASSMAVVSNGSFMAELMNKSSSSTAAINDNSNDNGHGLTLLIGTIMALFVWFGIYVNSPQLFRLSGCAVWFSTFYFLTHVFFLENESVQKSVLSLFAFSPIVAAIYIFNKTQSLNNGEISQDTQFHIGCFCVFGCLLYLSYYFRPLQMYSFLTNDFMQLSLPYQIISLFIAVSLGSFLVILCKNCGFLIPTQEFTTHKYPHLDTYYDTEVIAGLHPEIAISKTHKQRKRRKRTRRKKKRAD